jgi:cephalosporin-C deacetylase
MKRIIISSLIFLIINQYSQAQTTPAPMKYIEFILTPDKPDWIYQTSENANIKVYLLKNNVPLENIEISYEVGSEMLPPTEKGTVTTKNGSAVINIGTCKIAGFRQCKVSASIEGHKYTDLIKVAYSPQEIKPTVILPDDFIAFWDKAKAENAAIPTESKSTYLPEYSTSTTDVFLVSIQNYRIGQHIYGYLCKPKAEGKYPVILIPPGAGIKQQTPSTFYAEQGFISLSTEIHGISPLLSPQQYEDINNAFGEYMYNGIDDPDRYYYKRVYLGCVRAIDFLCSLPEFDGENIAVTGGSQGGALSIITAALDNRVKCLAAFYPALCDLTGYLNGRAGGWPNLFSPQSRDNKPNKEKLTTLSYYDVVNFARQIKVPGFYSWGFNDNTCPPTSVYAAINSIVAPKQIQTEPITGHWRFPETNQKSIDWIKKQLGMK